MKIEKEIVTPQQPHLILKDGRKLLNLCSNNYLGLANHPALIASAKTALDQYGLGMASVRFICGTQTLHKQLEHALATFLGLEETILYSSCFDANGGLFETLLNEEDAVISDSLNHASIIDGIRLCKAKRFRYLHNDMTDLEKQLIAAKDSNIRLIATDGVFSMDGEVAHLKELRRLADKYQALLMVDDCHVTGILGANGRGSPDFQRIDILTGTFGKALGGASGGFTAASKDIITQLRQRSRPYLFSNSLPPPLVAAALTALDIVQTQPALRQKLLDNTTYFRKEIGKYGYTIIPGEHPIIPIIIGDEEAAQKFAQQLFEAGIYAVSLTYPVVPKATARIRLQMSAAHSREDLDQALEVFKKLR